MFIYSSERRVEKEKQFFNVFKKKKPQPPPPKGHHHQLRRRRGGTGVEREGAEHRTDGTAQRLKVFSVLFCLFFFLEFSS